MMYRTHISTSLFMGAGLSALCGFPFGLPYVMGITLGSLLPDIDEPNSFIGRRSFGLAEVIHKKFGHRGMTHSLVAWSVLTIICTIPSLFLEGFQPIILGIAMGYLFHLVGDYFSVSSIPIFYPYQRKGRKRKFAYTTGSVNEKWIYIISSFAFLYLFIVNELYLYFVASIIHFLTFLFELSF